MSATQKPRLAAGGEWLLSPGTTRTVSTARLTLAVALTACAERAQSHSAAEARFHGKLC